MRNVSHAGANDRTGPFISEARGFILVLDFSKRLALGGVPSKVGAGYGEGARWIGSLGETQSPRRGALSDKHELIHQAWHFEGPEFDRPQTAARPPARAFFPCVLPPARKALGVTR